MLQVKGHHKVYQLAICGVKSNVVVITICYLDEMIDILQDDYHAVGRPTQLAEHIWDQEEEIPNL